MVHSIKRLLGLPVRTRQGIALGSVSDFEIEEGRISAMRVKTGGLIRGLSGDELLVSWQEIAEIRVDAVIVEDALAEEEPVRAFVSAKAPAAMALLSDPAEE